MRYLKRRELGHDGCHDLVGFARLHALCDYGFYVVAANLRDRDVKWEKATECGERRIRAAIVAYHALRIEKLQHIRAASVGAGVYAAAQPAAPAFDAALGQRAQQKSLVVCHAEASESSGYFRKCSAVG